MNPFWSQLTTGDLVHQDVIDRRMSKSEPSRTSSQTKAVNNDPTTPESKKCSAENDQEISNIKLGFSRTPMNQKDVTLSEGRGRFKSSRVRRSYESTAYLVRDLRLLGSQKSLVTQQNSARPYRRITIPAYRMLKTGLDERGAARAFIL